MSPSLWFRWTGRLLLVALTMLMVTANASAAWKEKVLYSFQDGSDGNTPAGGVVFDKAGNLYGATSYNSSCGNVLDCGAVFQLSLQRGVWVETTLHDFQGYARHDGGAPEGGVILDASGNVYGTTAYGGTGKCVLLGTTVGCGTVYELSPPTQKGGKWTYAVLYDFQGGNDGLFPWGDLVFDKLGNLYGATQFGGGKGTTCNQYFDGNCGTVFKLSPPKQKGGAWKEKILHSFAGGTDGANPNGGLVLDSKGAIYGTTFGGGNESGRCGGQGCGTAFKLVPTSERSGSWAERLIHTFKDGSDGAQPAAGLIVDKEGSLLGTAGAGANSGVGVVYQLTNAAGRWNDAVLYEFTRNGGDGAVPLAGLIFDAAGNLYSTTNGGTPSSPRGNVFQLRAPGRKARAWTLNLLHNFDGPPDGMFPAASIKSDKNGNLYGTTQQGGTGTGCQGGCGAVFEVSP